MKHFALALTCLVLGSGTGALAGTNPNQKKKSSSKASETATSASAAPAPAPATTIQLADFRDSLSYALGTNVIATIKQQQIDINPMILMRSLEDAFTGQKPALNEQDMMKVFQQFEQSRQQNASADNQSPKSNGPSMEENKAKGAAFLAENAKKAGVTTTASGLQYRVITQGTGAKPLATDKVKVHYKGTLIDGSEFDSSYKRGEPIEFPLNGVIKGWTEGVQLMSVGSKYEFFIPSELAYGDREVGGVIPAGSTLVFEVELLGIPSQSK
ncbi:MAG: FKBP-type peptidyl-prolyl cis-trans isomerase [Candidatus Kapaibacterium sp.]